MAWVALGGAILREGSIPQGDSIPRAHSIRIISRFTATGIIFITMGTTFTTTETTFSIIVTSLTTTSSSGSVTRFMATLITIIPMIMGITIIRENPTIANIGAISPGPCKRNSLAPATIMEQLMECMARILPARFETIEKLKVYQ
jgi:hypothetical protein